MRCNRDIRAYALQKGVYMWELADQLCISAGTLSRILRTELPEEDKQHMYHAIRMVETTKRIRHAP